MFWRRGFSSEGTAAEALSGNVPEATMADGESKGDEAKRKKVRSGILLGLCRSLAFLCMR